MNTGRVILGRIGGPHGLHGWVKAESFTDPPENLGRYRTIDLLREGIARAGEILEWKRAGRGVALRLAGCETIEAAQALNGVEIAIERAELPPAEPGQYYLHDLVGLQGSNREGVPLGTVTGFLDLPAHPVLVLEDGERERLVPCVRERMLEVDLAGGRIVLDWHPDD
jgi:16S rRNA processing protein RimM